MPVIQIDVMEGVPEAEVDELLDRTSARYAELLGAPVERIRATVNEVPATHWRVGGKADSEPAPLIRVELMRGRPPELIEQIMAELSALVADILSIPVSRTRVRVEEMEPAHWGIGGVPAARARADEVAARAEAQAAPGQ